LLRIDRHHQIDANELAKNFRDVQNQIHPDKFSGKSKEEQKLSAEWSSLINKAYTIIQNPLKRGMYLLKSEGMTIPEENTITDTEFLMEMLERNEEVR
jgi:molecular chaperone HscB